VVASPAFVSGTALKRDRLLGVAGATLSKEVPLAREMQRVGSGPSILWPGVVARTQAEADRIRTFSIGLNRETRDTFTGLDTVRAAQGAAAAMFPGVRASEALRSVGLLGGARLTKDAQRMLERGAGLGEIPKMTERYNAIQTDWLRFGYAVASGDVAASPEEATSEATLDLDLADIAFRRWLKRLSPSQLKWLGIYLLSLQQIGIQLEASGWMEMPEPFNRSLSAALWFVTVLVALADNSRER
jgi:hypothetical protein